MSRFSQLLLSDWPLLFILIHVLINVPSVFSSLPLYLHRSTTLCVHTVFSWALYFFVCDLCVPCELSRPQGSRSASKCVFWKHFMFPTGTFLREKMTPLLVWYINMISGWLQYIEVHGYQWLLIIFLIWIAGESMANVLLTGIR